MQDLHLPYHLLIPALAAALGLGYMIAKRGQRFRGDSRWRWTGLAVFLGAYCIIVSGAAYTQLSSKLALQAYDLNGDGFFSEWERNADQQSAMEVMAADTAQTFAPLTAGMIAGCLALGVVTIGKLRPLVARNRTMPFTSGPE